MTREWPEGEGPTLPDQARARFHAAVQPHHEPKGPDDPRLKATRDDPVPDGGAEEDEGDE